MTRILRALFISAVATGAAALVLSLLGVTGGRPEAGRSAEVDADALPAAQRDLLLQELDAQL